MTERSTRAVRSLRAMSEPESLAGKTFLDIGSGSGLLSLAVRRLGARVHSFDYDPNSVGCTQELRRRYFPDDEHWVVASGSALDAELHRFAWKFRRRLLVGRVAPYEETCGRRWRNAAVPVSSGGTLFIAIYNDQGGASIRWAKTKRLYNRLPRILRFLVVWPSFWVLNWRTDHEVLPAPAAASLDSATMVISRGACRSGRT